MRDPLIEFQNVTVARDGRRLLDAVSLTIREGSMPPSSAERCRQDVARQGDHA